MKIKESHIFIFFAVSIIVMVLFHYATEYDKKSEPIEYPLLHTHRNEVKGYVSKKTNSWISNTYKITLTNGQKFRIHEHRFLSVGDSIFRPEGFDSLYVFRNGKLIFGDHFYIK